MEAVIIKADQSFVVSILTSVCCNVLKLIWNEELGIKPPFVPKTFHSMPTFAQNVHPNPHPSNMPHTHTKDCHSTIPSEK